HELRDDWFDGVRSTPQQLESEQLAFAAMDAYQYAAMPMAAPAVEAMPHRDYGFSAGGFEFYVLDTRFERGAPGTCIGFAKQHERFARWLQEHTPAEDRPIFIVSPTPVFPFDVEAGRTEDRMRGGGWQSYPQSLTQLFDALFAAGCVSVVILSGDRHISHRATGSVLHDDGRRITLDSIVSSGLNTPIPFASDHPGDIQTSFKGPISPHCTLSYTITTESQSTGWAEVRIETDAAGRWLVDAVFQ
ncbi:MAG: alkaline phosphatase D family protein, partial [Burkholderiaceae bacterium]